MKPKQDYSDQADIDRKATAFVDQVLIAAEWQRFTTDPDYRIDYDVEPRRERALTGKRASVQQKGHLTVKISKTEATCGSLDVDHVKYWVDQYSRPVFLFLVDVTTKQGWWLFVQKHMLDDLPEKVRSKWRAKQTLTVKIPIAQSLQNLPLLEQAIKEAYRYMSRLHPISIQDAIAGQIAKLESIAPEFKIGVNATNGVTNFILSARDKPVEFKLFLKGPKERQQALYKDLIERGLPIEVEPGEIELQGSALFNDELWGQPQKIQFGMVQRHDIILEMDAGAGDTATIELRIPNATFQGGSSEIRFDGNLWDGLISIEGTMTKDRSFNHQIDLSLNLAKWRTHDVSELPYFAQVAAFVRAGVEGRTANIFVEILGKRVPIGKTASLSGTGRDIWDALSHWCAFLEHVLKIGTRLKVQFRIPREIDQDDYELAETLDTATKYESQPSPDAVIQTEVAEVPDGSLDGLNTPDGAANGALSLKKEDTEVDLLGTHFTVPAHCYNFTHMSGKILERTGPSSAKIKWTATKDTILTVSPISAV